MAPAGRRSRWRPGIAVAHEVVCFTGAPGLVGGAVLRRMLAADPALRAVVLVRDAGRWEQVSTRLALPAGRVGAVVGDVTRPGLGLSADTRVPLAREITAVVHAAADVVFSHPLAVARAVNVAGGRHVPDVAAGWPRLRRFAHVSTAFVAGRRVGRILEGEERGDAGWVNAYEQSKHEDEWLVRASGRERGVFRPSNIVSGSAVG